MPEFHEVVAMLQARARDVAGTWAPGGHVDGGRYWALCPWRDDKRIGSFYVNLAGAYAGRWADHAGDPPHGDMLDLIQLAARTDRRGAFDIACRWLGLAEETPAQRDERRRRAQHDRARVAARQKAEAERTAQDAAKKRSGAQGLWLHCKPGIAGTPVEAYLAGRGIRLAALGREPNAIRFHPALHYHHIDPETGEIFEGDWPAMVTAIYGPHVEGGAAAFWGVHRTWLARRADGSWGKAPVPKAKKVMGSLLRGYIRLWAGSGPRGGKAAPLARARPGARVYVTEGIEDGLSLAVLMPEARVAVAGTLGNMARMELPPAVTDVVLVADNDPGRQAREAFEKAIGFHAGQGRSVRVWRNEYGGKDLNDALRAAVAMEGAA